MADRSGDRIRYEPDEPCRFLEAIGVGIQGIIIGLAPTVLIVAVTAVAAGQDDRYLSWAVFAALIISGLATVLQAARIGRLGGGHVLIMGASPNFIAVSVLAIESGGAAMLASLIVLSSLFYLAVAAWLPQLRRIITPVVSGTVLMLIAAMILPIAFDRLKEVPEGASTAAGPTVAAVTLAVSTVLMLRGSAAWRPWSLLIGIAAGCASAAPLGIYEFDRLIAAPWVGRSPQRISRIGSDTDRGILGASGDVSYRYPRTGNQGYWRRDGCSAGIAPPDPGDGFPADPGLNLCQCDWHSAFGHCRDTAHDLLFVIHRVA